MPKNYECNSKICYYSSGFDLDLFEITLCLTEFKTKHEDISGRQISTPSNEPWKFANSIT